MIKDQACPMVAACSVNVAWAETLCRAWFAGQAPAKLATQPEMNSFPFAALNEMF
ncbi:hypothetical protein Mal33_47570 [Rosistilla oblonga]|uniref:Uncharacterized protein n=1 Tax=Rosistilla oblonga TaxID=2527990 RepID=A0A518J070_9BACT|nr:hypothetical protein Mal33_47570 [Rosistilla oblonga]